MAFIAHQRGTLLSRQFDVDGIANHTMVAVLWHRHRHVGVMLPQTVLACIFLFFLLVAFADIFSSGVIKPLIARPRPTHEPTLEGLLRMFQSLAAVTITVECTDICHRMLPTPPPSRFCSRTLCVPSSNVASCSMPS